MTVKFKNGVPNECVDWLWANVGPGNLVRSTAPDIRYTPKKTDAWFYDRVAEFDENNRLWYTPTITVKDEQLATLFVLRWS